MVIFGKINSQTGGSSSVVSHKQLAIRGKRFMTQATREGRLSRSSAKREGGSISAWIRDRRATKPGELPRRKIAQDSF
jgi:hypothetical protein